MKKLVSIMWNLQTHYNFWLDFQKVDQHTGRKWLIHDTKHHKDNQSQSLELNPGRSSKHGTSESKVICSIQYSKAMSRGGNIQGGAHLQNQNYLVTGSLNVQFEIKRTTLKITLAVTTIIVR